MKYLLFILFGLSLLTSGSLSSQEIPKQHLEVFNYGIKEGLEVHTDQAIRLNEDGIIEFFNGSSLYHLVGGNFLKYPKYPYVKPNDHYLFTSEGLLISRKDSLFLFGSQNSLASFRAPSLRSKNVRGLVNSNAVLQSQDSLFLFNVSAGSLTKYSLSDYFSPSSEISFVDMEENYITFRGQADNEKDAFVVFKISSSGNIRDIFKTQTTGILAVINDSTILASRENELQLLQLMDNEWKNTILHKQSKNPIRLYSCFWKDQTHIIAWGEKIFTLDLASSSLEYELLKNSNFALFGSVKNNLTKIFVDSKTNVLYAQTIIDGLYAVQLDFTDFRWLVPEDPNIRFVSNLAPDSAAQKILFTSWSGQLSSYDLRSNRFEKILENQHCKGVYLIESGKYLAISSTAKHHIIELQKDNTFNIDTIFSDIPLEKTYFNNLLHSSDSSLIIYAEDFHIVFDKLVDKIDIKKVDISSYQPYVAFQTEDYLFRPSLDHLYFLDDQFKKVDSIYLNELTQVRDIIQVDKNSLVLADNQGIIEVNLLEKTAKRNPTINEKVFALTKSGETLFLSTTDGILVHKDNASHRIARRSDLPITEFNSGAVVHIGNEAFFGSVSGILSINTLETYEQPTSEIGIYRATINGSREVILYDQQLDQYRLELEPDEHHIELKLFSKSPAIHNYSNYQYALEPDTLWQNLENSPTVNLALGEGNHRIYLGSGNNFNPSMSAKTFIDIHVAVYWWNTNWFKLLLTAFIISLFFGGLFIYKRGIQKEQIRSLRAEEFTNQERIRIAQDLHDNIGIQMSIIRRSISFLKDNISVFPKENISESLLFIDKVTAELNQELRDTIWASNKNKFLFSDLVERLSSLIHRVNTSNTSEINLVVSQYDGTSGYSPGAILHVFRIAQEALHNAIKHSGAKQVKVEIYSGDLKNVIEISDKGKGFNPENVESGNGLENMIDRAKKAGVELTIDSIIGSHTSIIIKLPQDE